MTPVFYESQLSEIKLCSQCNSVLLKNAQIVRKHNNDKIILCLNCAQDLKSPVLNTWEYKVFTIISNPEVANLRNYRMVAAKKLGCTVRQVSWVRDQLKKKGVPLPDYRGSCYRQNSRGEQVQLTQQSAKILDLVRSREFIYYNYQSLLSKEMGISKFIVSSTIKSLKKKGFEIAIPPRTERREKLKQELLAQSKEMTTDLLAKTFARKHRISPRTVRLLIAELREAGHSFKKFSPREELKQKILEIAATRPEFTRKNVLKTHPFYNSELLRFALEELEAEKAIAKRKDSRTDVYWLIKK
jgi:biotin operon repressor